MNEMQKPTTHFQNRIITLRPAMLQIWRLTALAVLFSALAGQSLFPAGAAETTEKAKEIMKETSAAVERAGSAAAETAKDLWQRVDEARLKNRTVDELVAWVIMGALVGAVAGMLTKLKPTGAGWLGRFGLGLAGAFLGGIVVHVGRFDFGWGPVLIRYEELFFSLVGAILLLVVGKIIGSRMKKKTAPK
jgi:uncharacterized membrane protein YeaQ/YmgE (transglycosylase-associated protein family)